MKHSTPRDPLIRSFILALDAAKARGLGRRVRSRLLNKLGDEMYAATKAGKLSKTHWLWEQYHDTYEKYLPLEHS